MTIEHVVRRITGNKPHCSRKYISIITHHSHMNPELLVDKLNELSINTGYRRFNLFIIDSGNAGLLENIREVILNNYVYTINIYIPNEDQLKALAHELCNGEIELLSPEDIDYVKRICEGISRRSR